MRVIRIPVPRPDQLDGVDAMVVVGRATSYQAQRVVRRLHDRGLRAVLVESADDLDPAWFAGCATVGLTAAACASGAAMEAVHDLLAALRPALRRAPASGSRP